MVRPATNRDRFWGGNLEVGPTLVDQHLISKLSLRFFWGRATQNTHKIHHKIQKFSSSAQAQEPAWGMFSQKLASGKCHVTLPFLAFWPCERAKSRKGRNADTLIKQTWEMVNPTKCVEVDGHGVNVLISIKSFKNFNLLCSFFAFSISYTTAFLL